MRISNIFSVPIWEQTIIVDKESIDYCINLKTTTDGRQVSNYGGFQSHDLDFFNIKEFSVISKQLNNIINDVQKTIDNNIEFIRTDFWVNVNQKGSFNSRHYHPSSSLSGVVYLQVNDDTGTIVFESDSIMQHYPLSTNSPLFKGRTEYKPIVGSVIIFPSWIPHYVNENNSDMDRISIAFNLLQKGFYKKPIIKVE